MVQFLNFLISFYCVTFATDLLEIDVQFHIIVTIRQLFIDYGIIPDVVQASPTEMCQVQIKYAL